MPTSPPSTRTVIERALEETIARLSRLSPTPEVRGYLIEARRLRSLMATWRAIPPHAEARREMLARVMQLAASVASESASDAIPAVSGDSPAAANPPPTPVTPAEPRAHTLPAAARRQRAPRAMGRLVSVAPGVTIVDPEMLEWSTYHEIVGVALKLLHHDPVKARFTALVKMDPGAMLPAHRHEQPEEIYVLSGAATVGRHRLRAGDYCRAESGTIHEPTNTLEGCTFLIQACDCDAPLDGGATPPVGIEPLGSDDPDD